MILIQGENGQGKSNLLEAIYVLAVAKSPRATTDRELIRRESNQEETYSRLSATIQRESDNLSVQIDYRSVPTPADEEEGPDQDGPQRIGPEGISVQKYVRVNGSPRRASDLVGQVNAVMFSAEDLELVHGPPTGRRRYLDILISQVDHHYLRSLQRYQRVVSQRNHLLKLVRQGGSRGDELDFWDEELIKEGKYLMERRVQAVQALSRLAGSTHRELTEGHEGLDLIYRPSIPIGPDASAGSLARDLRHAIHSGRQRETAQGFTVFGPHRDDLQLLIEGMDAAAYASRGQTRTAVLAMRLAEAHYLMDRSQQEPILLLDDVLSELDSARRTQALDTASRYQQCFITTTDVDSIDTRFLRLMSRFVVREGRVEPVAKPNDSGAA